MQEKKIHALYKGSNAEIGKKYSSSNKKDFLSYKKKKKVCSHENMKH